MTWALVVRDALWSRPDLRYFRQGFELTIELSEQDVEDIESGRFDSLGQRFAEDHRRLYGFALDTSIELVNLRCVALARADQPELRWQAAAQDVAAVIGEQELYWDGGWHAATIYDRRGLELGRSISGPALVVEPTATTVVPPGHRCVVDESGCLLMHGAHASTGPRADTTTIDRVSSGHHRGCAEAHALRDGRGRVPRGHVNGDSRAARRIPVRDGSERQHDRRAVRRLA